MTSRERLSTVLRGEIPDCVPVMPDVSNMVPVRMTGKPFWDIYLYENPPKWKAYIDCAKHFGFDSLLDGAAPILFEELGEIDHEWTEAIVARTRDRIITQKYRTALGHREWTPDVTVYYIDNPPSRSINPLSIGLPAVPGHWEPVEGRMEWPQGEELLRLVKREMGDQGLVGVSCGTSLLIHSEQEIMEFYDNPQKFYDCRDELLDSYERRFNRLIQAEVKPDFIATGASGTLVFQTPKTFRELGLPIVKKITALSRRHGLPTHVHSCGPEKELVRILHDETDLTVVDPLEIPPMGDCVLPDIKRLYGDTLVLKGNLHTTNVMLRGTVRDVIDASRKAIDDAAAGGRFILSTGDQCGRDTPDENLFAMIETARTYGRY